MPGGTERRATGSLVGYLPGLPYGGDSNPEQWRQSSWPEDATLMQEADVNLVTVEVFAWARLKPSPGRLGSTARAPLSQAILEPRRRSGHPGGLNMAGATTTV
jgi:hypothetical protein